MKILKLAAVILLLAATGGLILLLSGNSNTALSAAPQTSPNGLPNVTMALVAGGLNRPVDITNAGDDRLFVVEQAGIIKIIDNGTVLPVPFLNITDRVETMSEQGLLGLTFHPDYVNNGFFYVNYTYCTENSCPEYGPTPNLYTRISRFAVTANPDMADPNSEVILLEVQQPYGNHNGGGLTFGHDGYLYIGMGDGGDGGDPQNYAQTPGALLGKMLRLDVDGGGNPPDCDSDGNYTIPPTNPFVDGAGGSCDEIWQMGLRNPWRFSFDRQTHDLYIGDVGQGAREEVNFQPASSSGGENWGWRCYEGSQAYNTVGCQPSSFYDFPFFDYPHSQGIAVTGGFVYRGADFPTLQGYYLFADYGSGNFWLALPNGSGGWTVSSIGGLPGANTPSSFGEGCDGELYVAHYSSGSGAVYQIQTTTQALFAGTDLFNYLPVVMRPDGPITPTPTSTAVPPSQCH